MHLFLSFIEQTEPFQKPVSLEQHPDYAEYIFHPMDLCTLEKVTSFVLIGPLNVKVCFTDVPLKTC